MTRRSGLTRLPFVSPFSGLLAGIWLSVSRRAEQAKAADRDRIRNWRAYTRKAIVPARRNRVIRYGRRIGTHRQRAGLALVCAGLLLTATACKPGPKPGPDAGDTEDVAAGTTGEGIDPASTGDAAAGSDAAQRPEDVDLSAMDAAWPTELLAGESGAPKKVILNAIGAGKLPAELPLTADFRGEDFAERPRIDAGLETGVSLYDWGSSLDPALPAERWAERFDAWLAEFAVVDHTEIHTWEVQLLDRPGYEAAIEVVEALWIEGATPEGRRREDRLYLVFELVKDPALAATAEPTPEATAVAEGDAAAAQAEPPAPKPADLGWRIAAIRSREGRTALIDAPYFKDVTERVMPGGYDQAGAEVYTAAGPALGDVDGDGDLDLFLPRMHASMRLYANDGSGRFSDVTEAWGLYDRPTLQDSISGVFTDLDQDGRLDLLVLFQGRGLRAWHNEGSRFRDITGPAELAGPGEWQTLSVADVDGDGYPDAYLSNYNLIDATHQPVSYVDATDGLPNRLLRNTGDLRFEDATEASGLGLDNTRWTYAAAFADYDADGDPDLYVANDYGPNHLFQNDGKGGFVDVTDALKAGDQANGMGVSWFDFDGDLDLDVYVSNMQSFAGNRITRLANFPGTPEQAALYRRFSQGSTLLRNDMGSPMAEAAAPPDPAAGFTEWSEQAGVKASFWAWGSAPFDYDADGDEDLFGSAGFYTGANAADT